MPPSNEYNKDTKRTERVRKHFPRIKPIAQRGFESFYSKIIDPGTGKPYEERDTSGSIVKQSDGLPPARHIVHLIVRVRSFDGKEYLYTLGNLHGFNSFGSPVSFYVHKLETWTKTLFDKQRRYDPKSERIIEVTTSPIGQQEIYMLPFSAEAVDQLFSKTIKPNTSVYWIRNNRNKNPLKPVNFVVRDKLTGVAINIEWSSLEKTLELFKTKSFEYLFDANYVPEPIKQEMRANIESTSGQKVQPSPTTVTADNNNNSSNTAANTNSTKDYSAYK
jgi:hypothetical protein